MINEILEKDLTKKAQKIGDYLVGKLKGLQKYGVIREIRGKGVLRGVELVKDTSTMEPFPSDKKLGTALKKTALENGLIMRIEKDWFAVAPPLIAEEADNDEMYDLIEKSLEDAIKLV